MSDQMLETKITKIMPVIRRYPVAIQLELLKYYLVFLLKDFSKEQIISQCVILQNTIFSAEELVATDLIDDIASLLGVVMSSKQSGNQKLKKIKITLEKLQQVLRQDTANKDDSALAVINLVKQIYHNDKFTKVVMNDSVEEMFEQIFDSFDPAKAENYLDNSIAREGVERKAALYDAMCEKYEQLLDYHQTGLMLKDFRRVYKTKLKGKE